jgi:heme A synthase
VGAFVVTSSPAWRLARDARREGDEHGVRVRAVVALVVVYAQIVVGAWLRHSGAQDALGLHVLLGLGAAGALLALAGAMRDSGAASLRRLRLWIVGLLAAQLALGLLTTFAILVLSGGFQSAVSVTEAVAATAHVAVGALLLASTLAAVLWSWRLFRAPASGVKELREQHA